MRKIIKTFIGLLFLLIGVAIYLYPNYREWELQKTLQSVGGSTSAMQDSNDSADKEDRIEKQIENETSETETEVTEEDAESDSSMFLSSEKSVELFKEMEQYNLDLISQEQTIIDAWTFKQTPVDLSGLNNDTRAIGSIEIPDIKLTLPLYIGASEENMSRGAVVLAGTSIPIGGNTSNCVIAAHRGWSGSPYFRDIDQLKIGSEIILTNPWEKLKYQVTGTEIIHATETDILNIQPGKDMITLFSCYPYGSVGTKYRQVIFCERVREDLADEKQSEKEISYQDNNGQPIKELTDQILQEKGIVIEEDFPQTLASMEDKLRLILPIVLGCFVLLIMLIRHLHDD